MLTIIDKTDFIFFINFNRIFVYVLNHVQYLFCRDHSDGIWNESQATVLQVDSGTENGTGLSASEPSAVSPGSAMLLTPSSRRKHLLLLQHQQRSSMDTDALDEEDTKQGTDAEKVKFLHNPRRSARSRAMTIIQVIIDFQNLSGLYTKSEQKLTFNVFLQFSFTLISIESI